MVKALFDTNILIDHLHDIPGAHDEVSRYTQIAISTITWIEVMVGTTPRTEAATRAYLANYDRVALTDHIAEDAVRLRKLHRLRLPDAVIWASARAFGGVFVTRNTKDFSRSEPGIRFPYVV